MLLKTALSDVSASYIMRSQYMSIKRAEWLITSFNCHKLSGQSNYRFSRHVSLLFLPFPLSLSLSMLQMFIPRRIIHRLPHAHKLLTNIGRTRVFQLNEPNSQTSTAPFPCPSTSARTPWTHVAKSNSEINRLHSPRNTFLPRNLLRDTHPFPARCHPPTLQPFFRAVPTLASVATSMQAAQCHLRVRAFAFPPFPSREFPPSHFCVTFPTLSKGVFSFSFSLIRIHTHTYTRTRTTFAGLAHQVDSLMNGRARFRLWRSTSP